MATQKVFPPPTPQINAIFCYIKKKVPTAIKLEVGGGKALMALPLRKYIYIYFSFFQLSLSIEHGLHLIQYICIKS